MNNYYPKDYDYLGKSASDTDCTGLIPNGPVYEMDLLDYQNLYQFGGQRMADTIRDDVLGKRYADADHLKDL